MSVFLDTNVLVSAVATRGLCADVLRETLLSHQLLVSTDLLRELEKVLREKIGLPQSLLSEFIEFIQKNAHSSKSSPIHKMPVEDEGDIPILSAALDGKAGVFVTGDRGIIELGRLGSMQIVSPRGFWEKLKSSEKYPPLIHNNAKWKMQNVKRRAHRGTLSAMRCALPASKGEPGGKKRPLSLTEPAGQAELKTRKSVMNHILALYFDKYLILPCELCGL